MRLLFFVTFICFVAFAWAGKELCSYDYCADEELSSCRVMDKDRRDECNRLGGLLVTYRKGSLRGSEHKCCQWRMSDIQNKYLYCVRNIRSSSQLCTTDTLKDYKVKIKTTKQCVTVSCT